jgi:hypothetical protein
MNIKIGKKPLLAAGIFAGAIAAIVFLAILPVIGDIESAGEQMRQQLDGIAGYEKKILAAREFAAFQKEEKTNMEKIGRVFVDAKMPLDFINSLETLARDSSIKIEFSSSVQQDKGGKEPPSMNIEADLSGSLPGMLFFLGKIENSPYLVRVMSANIKIEEKAVPAPRIEDASTTVEIAAPPAPVETAEAHILLKAYAK